MIKADLEIDVFACSLSPLRFVEKHILNERFELSSWDKKTKIATFVIRNEMTNNVIVTLKLKNFIQV